MQHIHNMYVRAYGQVRVYFFLLDFFKIKFFFNFFREYF